MEALQINLLLIPGSDDPPIGDPAYQQELERLGQSLDSQGWEVASLVELRESADGGPTVSGYVITLAPYLSTVLAAALAALGGWLHGRNGRKVKLKFGTVGQLEEVEAQTPEQLKEMMAIAEKYIQRNHTTVIP